MPISKIIQPINRPINGIVQTPGSKSISNRAMLLAAMANGDSKLHGILHCDDTLVMLNALKQIGVDIVVDWERSFCTVQGAGGKWPVQKATINVQNSGTSIRFLTAALAMTGGDFLLSGTPRMHERPIKDLTDALVALGADVQTTTSGKFPPVQINRNPAVGGSVKVRSNLSSQYLSALLMAAPLARKPVQISVEGNLVSEPYVAMTLKMIAEFGVTVESKQKNTFTIEPHCYTGRDYTIEPDASAASYFFAAAAICGGSATVKNLSKSSIQGDIQFVEVLERMGCRVIWGSDSIEVFGPAVRGVDVDMSEISDTVQTLAAVALFVSGETTVRGVAHNRVKETDRIGNLAIELRKLGAVVEEFADGLRITPGKLQGTKIDTYSDHRMAMSLSLVGLKVPGVEINDPECVSKTYPGFFADMESFVES